MKCIFRRTRGGRWAVCGPAEVVVAGATVEVEKRDGSTVEVEIASTGKPFERDGVEYVYGYKVAKKKLDKAALQDKVAELQAQLAKASASLAEAAEPVTDAAE